MPEQGPARVIVHDPPGPPCEVHVRQGHTLEMWHVECACGWPRQAGGLVYISKARALDVARRHAAQLNQLACQSEPTCYLPGGHAGEHAFPTVTIDGQTYGDPGRSSASTPDVPPDLYFRHRLRAAWQSLMGRDLYAEGLRDVR